MDRREVLVMLGALMLCVFLAALDTSIVANALPRIIADLHGFELYTWVTTGYLLSSTAVTPIGGKLGDRYGRKPMLIGGSVFFLLTTLLCGRPSVLAWFRPCRRTRRLPNTHCPRSAPA
ncbi:MAG TPA: MFS transporter [Chloroflexota bacterium]|jgi:MFS family permease|nr:MFS transporter [Chloroflexota bacterium]